MTRTSWLCILLASFVVSVTVRADGPILHEEVPNLPREGGEVLLVPGNDGKTEALYDGERANALGLTQPMKATEGDGRGMEEAGRRSSAFQPDRVTELHGTVPYDVVFRPVIAPFKRLTALDQIVFASDGRTPILRTNHLPRFPVAIAEALAASDRRPRDRFIGEAVLDFSAGSTVPLPSVSPESRVLSMYSDPKVDLVIEKDAADNFFVTVTQRPLAKVNLIFVMDAPRSYFGAALPMDPSDRLARKLVPMPPGVRVEAERLAQELGLRRGMPFDHVMRRLVAHFRDFQESKIPPANSGSIVADLVRAKKGLCRHRAYGFVILAQALGIHARFAQNEAHAWTEVDVPSVGWMRIDLGGSPRGLAPRGGGIQGPFYRSANDDPFPKPPAYQRAYAELARLTQANRSRNGAPSTPRSVGAGPGTAQAGAAVAPLRETVEIVIDRIDRSVTRGAELIVDGHVRDAQKAPVNGFRLEVYLRLSETRLLGVSVTDKHGRFRGRFGVPPDIPVGDYGLLVAGRGDKRYESSSTLHPAH